MSLPEHSFWRILSLTILTRLLWKAATVEIVYSVHGVPIRLTDERWRHIVNARDDLAGYYEDCLHVVQEPDLVLLGYRGTLKAIKGYGRKGYLVVVYREISAEDGFVITAYFTRKIKREKIQWPRSNRR
jgi:hypothetical protein